MNWESQVFSTGETRIPKQNLGTRKKLYFSSLPWMFLLLSSPTLAAPGGVSTGLKLWLKANAGVTGNPSVTQWLDQSSNAFVAVSAAATVDHGTLNSPTVVSNAINFNPILSFNGTDQGLVIASGIFSTATVNDLNVYIVSSTTTIQDHYIFREAVNPKRITTNLPWSNGNIYWDAGFDTVTSDKRLIANWGGTINVPFIWSQLYSVPNSSQAIYRNGSSIASDTTASTFGSRALGSV